jgi:hypothetical protein
MGQVSRSLLALALDSARSICYALDVEGGNVERFYRVVRERAWDWSVYAVNLSGGNGECYGSFTYASQARALWRKLMAQ